MTLILALLLQADAKEFTKDWKSAWKDFGVGSWVKFKCTFAGAEMLQTEKVVKISGEFATLEVGDGEEVHQEQYFIGIPSEYDGKLAKTGEEDLTVAGRTYKCTVYEIAKSSGNTTQSLRVWKCADAPVWSLKEVFQSKTGRSTIGWTMEWAGSEDVKVGETTLTCQIFKNTTELGGSSTVETEWRNDAIPGRAAKRMHQSFLKGKELESSKTVETAVDFEKK